MNYIGSKLSLLGFLERSILKALDKKTKTKKNKVFCDLFAGTGAVGSHFKQRGYKIIANDIQYYSYVLNRHYIGNHKELKFLNLLKLIPQLKNSSDKKKTVCDFLSNLKGIKGFIYNNYSWGGTQNTKQPRQYFSDENAMLCDAVRAKIESLKKQQLLTEDEYYFLIASLLESIDGYANTTGVYGAFLKRLKKSALRKFTLKPAPLFKSRRKQKVFNEEANQLIKKLQADILYLDPPYNQRQYSANYHLLETIAKYDNPPLFGKTGLRQDKSQKSPYCSRSQAKAVFKDLILSAKAKYIFLSYNNEGLMSLKDIKEIMSLKGKYGCFTKLYNRYKADNNRDYRASKTVEYLHYSLSD